MNERLEDIKSISVEDLERQVKQREKACESYLNRLGGNE